MTTDTNTNTSTSAASDAESNDTKTTPADASTQQAVLEADSVDHDYGTVSVLEDVSTTVDTGTVTALIGPNGSGKTTLLRVLAGLLEPTSGSVSYRGDAAARRIGYLPQQPAFRPGFSVLETLRFYSSLVGADEAETDAWIASRRSDSPMLPVALSKRFRAG